MAFIQDWFLDYDFEEFPRDPLEGRWPLQEAEENFLFKPDLTTGPHDREGFLTDLYLSPDVMGQEDACKTADAENDLTSTLCSVEEDAVFLGSNPADEDRTKSQLKPWDDRRNGGGKAAHGGAGTIEASAAQPPCETGRAHADLLTAKTTTTRAEHVFPPLVFPSTLWTYLGCEMSFGQPQRQCTSFYTSNGSAAVVARVAVPPTAKQPSLGSGLAFIKPYRRRRRRADNPKINGGRVGERRRRANGIGSASRPNVVLPKRKRHV